jgi:hypothetical protein
MSMLPDCVFQHWVRSHEEDTEELAVYRPSGHDFPPARGREGFEVRRDGTFIDHPIGAGDENQAIQGEWQPQGPGRLHVRSAALMPRTIEIVYCDDAVLKVRRKS